MDIVFKTNKLEKRFNSEKELIKAYGAKNAKIIKMRMSFLRAASSLSTVPVTPPFYRHKLKGNYKGCYAVSLKHPFRLIFRPVQGGCDSELAEVTVIEIITVEDYH